MKAIPPPDVTVDKVVRECMEQRDIRDTLRGDGLSLLQAVHCVRVEM